MTIAVLLLLFFVLLAIGAPVAVSLGLSSMATALIFAPIPLPVIGQKVFGNVSHFTLMAVPFFFFAAALMEAGGLVRRLVNLANAFVGHLRGGLGITAVATCMMFAAMSGSSPATVAAVGRVMYPSLLQAGYSERYAIGALATAGSLGILLPPSIPLILYGFVTETSVTKLFIASLLPAVLYGGGLMLMARFLAPRVLIAKGQVEAPRPATWGERLAALRAAGPALLLPISIFVGIYGFPEFTLFGFHHDAGGIFTPTEASVVAATLALIIGMLTYQGTTLKSAAQTVLATAPSVGMVFFITMNALLFAFFVTKLGVPNAVGQFLVQLHMPQWGFLMMVNLILIVVGFFLEGVPTILMFVPLLFPAAKALGVDPIHFGIIVVVNIELGLIHPPVGLNLFVSSSISGLPVMEVFRAVLPWLCVTVVTLLLITFIPQISLFLPHLLFN